MTIKRDFGYDYVLVIGGMHKLPPLYAVTLDSPIIMQDLVAEVCKRADLKNGYGWKMYGVRHVQKRKSILVDTVHILLRSAVIKKLVYYAQKVCF